LHSAIVAIEVVGITESEGRKGSKDVAGGGDVAASLAAKARKFASARDATAWKGADVVWAKELSAKEWSA
jgi:hypothetical protein